MSWLHSAGCRTRVLMALLVTIGTGEAAWCQTAPAGQPPESEAASPESSISGYMELQFTNAQDADPVVDFRRFVLLFAHRFSDRIRFVSELELEHAVVEGAEEEGELELEQAFLDFLLTRHVNVRAGQLLAPVGLINERHEPPVFYGVQRPFVDTFIIPTTWFDIGAGVFGEFGRGWRYRTYVMAPLDATDFSADEGLADSSQGGSRSNVRHWAATARVEYTGSRRLVVGGGFWSGKVSSGSRLLAPALTILEVDARARVAGFQLRGEVAHAQLDQADELNRLRALREGVDPNLASQMFGAYGEVAHPLLTLPSAQQIVGFLRYERYDTQFRMPTGYQPLEQFNRSALVVGGSYFPDPDVVVKVDFTAGFNRSATVRAGHAVNLGLGWWF